MSVRGDGEHRVEFLAANALFADLTHDELRELASRCTDRHLERGVVVCHAGDESDAFFVIVAGELAVKPPGGSVTYMGPGECFGELGLLLGQARAATVEVTRSAWLLVLTMEDFRYVCARDAHVLEKLSQVLARRLARHGDDRAAPARVIAVRADHGLRGTSLVAAAVAAEMARTSSRPILHLRLDRPSRLAEGARFAASFSSLSADEVGALPTLGHVSRLDISCEAPLGRDERVGIDHVLACVGLDHAHVVVEVGHIGLERDAVQALADETVEIVISPSERTDGVHQVLNHVNPGTIAVPVNSTAPYVLPVESRLLNRPGIDVVALLRDDPRCAIGWPLRRLARKLQGRCLGLALGGGAAFGIAHIGVLDVFERAGISADLVVGTSMGSIVAICYSLGLGTEELVELARTFGTDLRTVLSVLDLNPLRPGVVSAQRLGAAFESYFGSAEYFSDLQVPCQTVALDIESGERVTIGDGRLIDAARASSSVPLLVAPTALGGRFLVDGAMCDPVPAEVVGHMGADVIVGINVVPQVRRGVTNALSRLTGRVGALNPLRYLRRTGPAPNLLDVTLNTIQTLQYELGQFKAISADVMVNPDLADFTWIEFHRAEELIERGAAAAREAVPTIERVLRERTGG